MRSLREKKNDKKARLQRLMSEMPGMGKRGANMDELFTGAKGLYIFILRQLL
jgi:hypothetical protein